MDKKYFNTLKKIFRHINSNFFKYPANTAIHIRIYEKSNLGHVVDMVHESWYTLPFNCKKSLLYWFNDSRYNIHFVDVAFESSFNSFITGVC